VSFAFLSAAVLVAVAEFGDKTQMLTLVLAARHGMKRVIAGVAIAVVVLQLLAVAAGGAIGAVVPDWVLAWATGALFIGFGIWTLVAQGAQGDDAEQASVSSARPVLSTAAVFFLAELGDKTQVMTMAIAAEPLAAARSLGLSVGEVDRLAVLAAVWAGSVVGMMAVNGVAALVGSALGSRLSPKLVARVSGVAFIGFGLLVIASQLLR
jgi:Ca2+/H+ antiporter, TMEM165/GDT1 family